MWWRIIPQMRDIMAPTGKQNLSPKNAGNADSAAQSCLLRQKLDYFPAQNCATLAFGENHPVGGKLQDRTELNLTSAAAVDSFL
jgi:hypothetical protein